MRIAVIGVAGNMGRRRLAILRELGERDLWLYDADSRRVFPMEVLSEMVRVPHQADIWEARPDCCLICTPPDSHLDLAIQAAQAGVRAVFIEKPLALEMPTSEQLAVLASCITMVGCNLRWLPVLTALRISSAIVGPTVSAAFWATYHLPTVRPDYRESTAVTGALFDTAWHLVDLALDWFGPAGVEYAGFQSARSIGLPDIDGSAGLVLRHHAGSESRIEANLTSRRYALGTSLTTANGTERWERTMPPDPEMFVAEIQAFIDCIREDKPTCNPVGRAADTLAILLKAREQWRA